MKILPITGTIEHKTAAYDMNVQKNKKFSSTKAVDLGEINSRINNIYKLLISYS